MRTSRFAIRYLSSFLLSTLRPLASDRKRSPTNASYDARLAFWEVSPHEPELNTGLHIVFVWARETSSKLTTARKKHDVMQRMLRRPDCSERKNPAAGNVLGCLHCAALNVKEGFDHILEKTTFTWGPTWIIFLPGKKNSSGANVKVCSWVYFSRVWKEASSI